MGTVIGYIVFTVVALIAVMQIWLFMKAKRQQGKPMPDLEGLIDNELLSRSPLLFYFYSPSCGPCRALTPRIDRLREEYDNVIKVDVSQQPEIARRLSVMGTPTLVTVRDGMIAEVLLGGVTDSKLEQLVEG